MVVFDQLPSDSKKHLSKDSIMIQQTSETNLFKQKLCNLLMKEMLACQTIKISKNASVYLAEDQDDLAYVIESGKVKLLMRSSDSRECIVAIYGSGDVFGKLCIGRLSEFMEKTVAMTDTKLRIIAYTKFLLHLSKESLLEDFIQYLLVRVAEQQQVMANLLTVDSEQRLGKTLLQLAKFIGKKSSYGTTIELKISHEELSEMVGTTRPRISVFMQTFRNLGLVVMANNHHMIIEEQKLSHYLTQIA